MKGPHTCDCLCALCERLGAGAFGTQLDGSPGVVVVKRRPRRRALPVLRLLLRIHARRRVARRIGALGMAA
jgi:hypothetical protein